MVAGHCGPKIVVSCPKGQPALLDELEAALRDVPPASAEEFKSIGAEREDEFADAFGVVAGLSLGDQADRAHDLAGRAEPALEAVMGDESRLHGMELIAVRDALDGEDVGAVMADRQRQA